MTKLYFRTIAANSGHHMAPWTPNSTNRGCNLYDNSVAQEAANCVYDVFHVTGFTETQFGNLVAETTTLAYGNGSTVKTSTWTPAVQSGLVGGTCLEVAQYLVVGGVTRQVTVWYSGPLVATGISETQWTFSTRIYNQTGVDKCYFYSNESDDYVDGITLTGSPTSIKMYTQSGAGPYTLNTRVGNWDNTNPTQRCGLGLKAGTGVASTCAASTTGYRHGVWYISLPFAQGGTVTAVNAIQGTRVTDSEVQGVLRASMWFATSTDTNRGSLFVDYNETDPLHTTASGEAWSPSVSPVTFESGDRAAVEWGAYLTAAAASHYFYTYGGATNATDLVEGSSPTTYPGWIELTLGSAEPSPEEWCVPIAVQDNPRLV